VAWTSEQGILFLGSADRTQEGSFRVRYRLTTGAPIVARPTFMPPNPKVPGDVGVLLATSQDGYVHALREKDGNELWRFTTGEPMSEPAAVVEQAICVTNQLGGMYCLNAKTGAQAWWAPEITKFISASKDRVYAANRLGDVAVLDARSGARLDVMPAVSMPIKLTNLDTDRIYLATGSGLIQCLHESELSDPIVHRTRAQMEAEALPAKKEAKPKEKKDDDLDKPAKPSKPAASAPKPKKKVDSDDTLKKPTTPATPRKERKPRKSRKDAQDPGLGGGAVGGGPVGGGPAAGGVQKRGGGMNVNQGAAGGPGG
jgi:hypothetical protein